MLRLLTTNICPSLSVRDACLARGAAWQQRATLTHAYGSFGIQCQGDGLASWVVHGWLICAARLGAAALRGACRL